MKTTALVVTSLLIVGVFVITQKNKTAKVINNRAESIVPIVTSIQPTVTSEIPLAISQPADRSTVTSPNILIEGKTVPNAEVIINDVEKKANAQGNFSVSILIDEGDNFITIVVVDSEGRYAERELRVTLATDSSFSPQ